MVTSCGHRALGLTCFFIGDQITTSTQFEDPRLLDMVVLDASADTAAQGHAGSILRVFSQLARSEQKNGRRAARPRPILGTQRPKTPGRCVTSRISVYS